MSIFRKLNTEDISPETIHILTSPMPPYKQPKKELPNPPFGVKVAQEFSNKNLNEAAEVIKNAIWNDIVREIKQGSKRSLKRFRLFPYYFSTTIDAEEKAAKALGTKLSKVLIDFGKELVKNGYAVRIENNVEPDTYLDTENNKVKKRKIGFKTHGFDSIEITIYWEEKILEAGAFLEYVDHSGPAIRKISKDNTEYFTHSCKKTIITEEELENGNQDNG